MKNAEITAASSRCCVHHPDQALQVRKHIQACLHIPNFALKIRKIKQKENQEFNWTGSLIEFFWFFLLLPATFSAFPERNFLSEQSLELCTFFETGELNQVFQRFVRLYKL